MAMNRRFRRPFRKKQSVRWHREQFRITALAANTTSTTNILLQDDWHDAGQLSPGNVTLVRCIVQIDVVPASNTLGRCVWQWGIEILDADSAPSTIGTQDDLIDERWIMIGTGRSHVYTAASFGGMIGHHQDRDTRVRAKLADCNVNLSLFNDTSSVANIEASGIVSLLITGDML